MANSSNTHISPPAWIAALAIASSFAVLTIAAAPAQSPQVSPIGSWRVQPKFKNSEARNNISGAACARTRDAFRACLAVNDEKKYAQFFSIAGNTIIPGAVIRLASEGRDPDAEGAAYDGGYFYVTGSHGRSRHSNNPSDSSYAVFRFKVNEQTGLPEFAVSEDTAVGVERSDKLRSVIASADIVRDYYDKALAAGGVNIEGIAVRRQRMFFGLRGPSVDNKAFILSVAVDGMFGGGDLQPIVHTVALGANTGIRDLASVADGLLILSGPVNEQAVTPAVFRWDEASASLTRLAALGGLPPDAKAETLLVLDERPDSYRVLIMFDGAENGRPMEYRIPR